MDLFLFKKLLSQYLHPLPVVVAMLALGWLMLAWARRRRRSLLSDSGELLDDYSVPKKRRRPGCFGMVLVFGALLLLYLCSIGPVADRMFFALERQYPPLQLDSEEVRSLKPDYIVILGGSESYHPQRPITSRQAGSSMARLVEGIRVHKSFPEAKMVITGGPVNGDGPSVAAEMGELAKLLGLEGEVILEEKARDTKDNAGMLQARLQDKSFILVTSGYHMPRAMGLFRGQGLKPVASPAETKVWPGVKYEHRQLIPSSSNLAKVNTALHEYLGLVWAFFRGQLGSDPQDASEEKKKDGEESKPVDDREILVRGQPGQYPAALPLRRQSATPWYSPLSRSMAIEWASPWVLPFLRADNTWPLASSSATVSGVIWSAKVS